MRNERLEKLLPAMSVNPDMCLRKDIANMAGELMEKNRENQRLREALQQLKAVLRKCKYRIVKKGEEMTTDEENLYFLINEQGLKESEVNDEN